MTLGGVSRRLADKREDSFCWLGIKQSQMYSSYAKFPLIHRSHGKKALGLLLCLKEFKEKIHLLLVILRNNRFSFHLEMLKKSGRSARALAETKPGWINRPG